MGKESQFRSTSARLTKKVLPLGARFLLGLGLVLGFSADEYHEDQHPDKGQNEPAKHKNLPEVESPEFEFLPETTEDKLMENLTLASFPIKPAEPNPPPQVEVETQKPIKLNAQKLTPEEEQKIEQFKIEFLGIEKKMKTRIDLFSEQDFEDLRMYYPIYAAASEKYKIPWYLVWIIHKAESTVSRNPTAYEPGRPHYGSMQRAVDVYSKEDVHVAAAGLEFLAAVPQRHYDDWEEIVWAASKLRKDQDASGSLLSALYSYVVDGESAEFRYQQFQIFSQVFEKKSKLK